MKPFDYKEWLSGKFDVVTRLGVPVSDIQHVPEMGIYQILAKTKDSIHASTSWTDRTFTIEGHHVVGGGGALDLMLIPKKQMNFYGRLIKKRR